VLAHETGHMLSMHHCTRFECLMNGVNHLAELDRSPIWLCPMCLRKLDYAIGLDVVDHYRKLGAFFRRQRLTDWSTWADARLTSLEAPAR
jgi:archaemetzincin